MQQQIYVVEDQATETVEFVCATHRDAVLELAPELPVREARFRTYCGMCPSEQMAC